MSDWADGLDPSLWTSGADLSSGLDPATLAAITGGNSGWTSGYDLGGSATPTTAGTSFNVGPGQIPSSVYQTLLGSGSLIPGASGASVPGSGSGGSSGGGSARPGLLTNADGSINWTSLLSLLGPLAAGAYSKSQTNTATQQMLDAANKANTQITGLLGGNASLYQPYQQAGGVGLSRLLALPQSNLAAQYRPLGTGAGFSLANVAKGT